MPKGSKTCPTCSSQMGPRTFVCKNCGYVFPIKKKEKAPQLVESTVQVEDSKVVEQTV